MPGGRVRLRVLAADGSPAAGASVGLDTVAGLPVDGIVGGSADTLGAVELAVPTGPVTLTALRGKDAKGTLRLDVPAGGIAEGEIRLGSAGASR
jgi:hypothetical protein